MEPRVAPRPKGASERRGRQRRPAKIIVVDQLDGRFHVRTARRSSPGPGAEHREPRDGAQGLGARAGRVARSESSRGGTGSPDLRFALRRRGGRLGGRGLPAGRAAVDGVALVAAGRVRGRVARRGMTAAGAGVGRHRRRGHRHRASCASTDGRLELYGRSAGANPGA